MASGLMSSLMFRVPRVVIVVLDMVMMGVGHSHSYANVCLLTVKIQDFIGNRDFFFRRKHLY